MQTDSLIQDLFSPVTFEDFIRLYREQRPLYVRGRHRDRFTSLLSIEGVDQLLAWGSLRFPDCRLAKEGRDYPQASYLVGDASAGVIDTDGLYAAYNDGATIILNSLQRYWRPLTEFCQALERRIGVPVQANAYVTPAASQGFGIHYDPHDVVVLQVSGRKQWRLFEGPVFLPTDLQLYNRSTAEIGKIRARHTLHPGDLIYVPRGQLHEAFTRDEPSIHITVGLLGLSWTDVLREALQQLVQSDADFRRSLPPGAADDDRTAAQLRRTLGRMRRKIAAQLPLESALAQVTDRFISRRPQDSRGRFVELATARPLNEDTLVMRRPDVLFRTWTRNGAIHLLFYRKKISFPRFVAPSLKFICETRECFRPAQLPGPLRVESKVLLCRTLLREGFLQSASNHTGQPTSRRGVKNLR